MVDKMDVIETLKQVMNEKFVFCIPPLSGGRKTEKPETPLHKHPCRDTCLPIRWPRTCLHTPVRVH